MGRQGGPGSDFYPRSPRGERLEECTVAPRADGFLSTLPARGATKQHLRVALRPDISIHAPREGSDATYAAASCVASYFYPRSPRGERRGKRWKKESIHKISIHAPREGSDNKAA